MTCCVVQWSPAPGQRSMSWLRDGAATSGTVPAVLLSSALLHLGLLKDSRLCLHFLSLVGRLFD